MTTTEAKARNNMKLLKIHLITKAAHPILPPKADIKHHLMAVTTAHPPHPMAMNTKHLIPRDRAKSHSLTSGATHPIHHKVVLQFPASTSHETPMLHQVPRAPNLEKARKVSAALARLPWVLLPAGC